MPVGPGRQSGPVVGSTADDRLQALDAALEVTAVQLGVAARPRVAPDRRVLLALDPAGRVRLLSCVVV
jgi:hypothetical protein